MPRSKLTRAWFAVTAVVALTGLVTQVVVTGIATGTGVESTARQAYEHGFHVALAIDAMTDARQEAHDYSIGHVFPRLGEIGTTQEIIDLLEARDA